MSEPVQCPTCQDTYWSREEERVVQDTAYIETSQPDAAMVFAEFRDEETIETKPLSEWTCANGHEAGDEEKAKLEQIR
jgi:hypothetical protein